MMLQWTPFRRGVCMSKVAWFVDKNHQLVHCEVVNEKSHARTIRLLEGEAVDKEIAVHPEGVSWGKLFPRLFVSEGLSRPDIFVCHGRVMLKRPVHQDTQSAIPAINDKYRFQPFIADVIDAVYQGQSVILTGGAGVGKTTHITQLAARINQPLLRINFNGETRMSDLIGKVHVLGGETKWVDGILPMAMRRGWWLLLDELDFAEPAVLSLLHPVLEDESILVLKENSGEIIRPHPNFRVFATANSIGAMSVRAGDFGGTNTMNEAFLDRWQVMLVDNLPVKEEIQVLRDSARGLKPAWAKKIAEFSARVRSGEDALSVGNFSTRKSIAWAKKTALHRNPIKGAQLAWLDKMPLSEQEVVLRTLKTFFGSGRKRSPKKKRKPSAKNKV